MWGEDDRNPRSGSACRGVRVKTKRDKQQEEPGKVTRRDEGRTRLSRTLKKRWPWDTNL